MLGRARAWYKGLSIVGKAVVITAGSLLAIGVVGAAANPQQEKLTNPSSDANVSTSVKDTSTEIKTETTTESIPYASSNVDDPNMASGTTQVKTGGVAGVKTITWEVTYTNGRETSREKISEQVTIKPVDEVIAVGTYIKKSTATSCPNGTYINSAGNSVCSPYASNGAPSGATAQCRDGTYSFSQSRQGTCSHHGGVATWL